MGSLKDEMRGLTEDHQVFEKTDDVSTGDSGNSSAPEGHQLRTGQEAATEGEFLPELHKNASAAEESDKSPISKDQVLSGGDGGNANQSDNKQDKDCCLADKGYETTTDLHNIATVAIEFSSDGGEGADLKKDENISYTTENNSHADDVLVPVPSTPNPSDPRSPAPFGQQHMRTQVSLEVVQCCSVATSPMTPPEGSHSFFFPSSFGKFGTADAVTKDAELQVGQKVEFCSVATSPIPMTPKTPATTAFPELIGRETAPKDEKAKKNEETQESVQKDRFASSESPEDDSEITRTLKFCTSKEVCTSNVYADTQTNIAVSGSIDSQGHVDDSSQQSKQPRMGSLDQDITILVTHYTSNNEEEEEDKEESASYFNEPDMAKIDETEEGESSCNVKKQDGKETMSTETNDGTEDISSTNNQHNKTDDSSDPADRQSKTCKEADNLELKEDKCEELRDVSATKPLVPESPAPFGCHNMRTQVSLEVVQCQSAATSPMTPPEGDQAFCFPSSLGKSTSVGAETKDAEMQVGQRVEFRSVATAPMTPRTPTTMTFPEVRKEKSIEEKIVEEEEDEDEQDGEKKDEVGEEQLKISEEKQEQATEQEAMSCRENDEEKCEEPVQEVSWDEKGMTWEVYGAVVEVAVLGSAIQKHLEKQVKKQKMQAAMPPPPPLSPSATPLTAEPIQRGSGSGKGRAGKRGEKEGKVARRRRNPFRQLMENMQQPNCCSRAHTAE